MATGDAVMINISLLAVVRWVAHDTIRGSGPKEVNVERLAT